MSKVHLHFGENTQSNKEGDKMASPTHNNMERVQVSDTILIQVSNDVIGLFIFIQLISNVLYTYIQ